MRSGGPFAPPLKCHSSKPSRSLARLGMTAAGSRFAYARKAPSLLVFDIHVLGVNHAFVFLLVLAVTAGSSVRPIDWAPTVRSGGGAGTCLRCLVHLLRQLVRCRG